MRAVLLVTCAVLVSAASFAQSPANQPVFEVASVKRSDPRATGTPNSCHGGPGTSDPGLFTCTNAALAALIIPAYHLQFYELVSPQWTIYGGGEDGYDVVAKIPAGTTKEQFQLMLQNLLAERFHLVARREARTLPVYVLRLGKGSPKIQSSPTTPPAGPPTAMTMVDGHLRFAMHKQPLATFVNFLTVPLAGPVTDETALQGDYDITVEFMPDARYRGYAYMQHTPEADAFPNLFQAIQDQLGLKLETEKRPVSVLVVDHADKVPVEN